MLSIYHKETGRQLFQLLLQLVAELRQTLTLDVLQFQFLRFKKGELHTLQKYLLAIAFFCFLSFFFFFLHAPTLICQHKVNVTTPSLQRPAALGGSPSPSLWFLFLCPPARSCDSGRGRHGLGLKGRPRLGLRPPVWPVSDDPGLPHWAQSEPETWVRRQKGAHLLLLWTNK